jgi:hypothetical protein
MAEVEEDLHEELNLLFDSDSEWEDTEDESSEDERQGFGSLAYLPNLKEVEKGMKVNGTLSEKANLIFPCSTVLKNLKLVDPSLKVERSKSKSVSRSPEGDENLFLLPTEAAIYLAAVLEYLSAELSEISGYLIQPNDLKRIGTYHIETAVALDIEFDELLENAELFEGNNQFQGVNLFDDDNLLEEANQLDEVGILLNFPSPIARTFSSIFHRQTSEVHPEFASKNFLVISTKNAFKTFKLI